MQREMVEIGPFLSTIGTLNSTLHLWLEDVTEIQIKVKKGK